MRTVGFGETRKEVIYKNRRVKVGKARVGLAWICVYVSCTK